MGACTNPVGKSPSKNKSNIIRLDGELRAQQKDFNLFNVEESNGKTISSSDFMENAALNENPATKNHFFQQNAQNTKKSNDGFHVNKTKNIQNQIKEEIYEADTSNNPEAIQAKTIMNKDQKDEKTLLYDPNTPLPVVFELSIEHAESGLVKSSKSNIIYCPAGNGAGRCNSENFRPNPLFRKRDLSYV